MYQTVLSIAYAVLPPLNLITVVLIFAVAVLLVVRYKYIQIFAHILLAIVALIFLVFAVYPVGPWMLSPLEKQFEKTWPLPQKIDGILVLGGALDADMSYEYNQTSLRDSAERLTEFIALVQDFPAAIHIYSGGKGEAKLARNLMRRMNVDTRAMIFEDRSTNTYENIVLSKKLINPQAGETWVLVTSAWHMPRAMAVAKAQGWDFIAYPVDHRTFGFIYPRNRSFDMLTNFQLATLALHEWVGLFVYYRSGYILEMFPVSALKNQDENSLR